MKNLPQFRNKSYEEIRQCILEKKGVGIGDNFNFGGLILWVFVILVIVAGGIGITKWLQKRQERKNYETYVETLNKLWIISTRFFCYPLKTKNRQLHRSSHPVIRNEISIQNCL